MAYAYTHSCDPSIPPRTAGNNTPITYDPRDSPIDFTQTHQDFETLQSYAAHVGNLDAASDCGSNLATDHAGDSPLLPGLDEAFEIALNFVFTSFAVR
ncbi:hypothetical protein OC835_001880 [Tilletia horrida]|nr:hypothetical protein OC835_001880 [Tilletia horrida]KAK0560146.1 hypothetical protein OC844_003942 [Tilletia horrida]